MIEAKLPASLAKTLGELKQSGWKSQSVKEEIRKNTVARIAADQQLFAGVLGYEETVMPQLENALLAGHDIVFLGERGQAKTRIIRSLIDLLDEWMPIVGGSEINDDPYAPVSRQARELVAHLIRGHGQVGVALGAGDQVVQNAAIVEFDAHAGGHHPLVLEACGGDLLAQRLDQVDVTIGDDLLDLLDHDLVGDDMANVISLRAIAFADGEVDVHDDALRLNLLGSVDADGCHEVEIAHENMPEPRTGAGDVMADHRFLVHAIFSTREWLHQYSARQSRSSRGCILERTMGVVFRDFIQPDVQPRNPHAMGAHPGRRRAHRAH